MRMVDRIIRVDGGLTQVLVRLRNVRIVVDIVSLCICGRLLCVGDESGAGGERAIGVPYVVRGLRGDDREDALGLEG